MELARFLHDNSVILALLPCKYINMMQFLFLTYEIRLVCHIAEIIPWTAMLDVAWVCLDHDVITMSTVCS